MNADKIKEILEISKIEKIANGKYLTTYGARLTMAELCNKLIDHDIFIKSSEHQALNQGIQDYFSSLRKKGIVAKHLGPGSISQEAHDAMISRISRSIPYVDYTTGELVYFDPELGNIVDINLDVYLAIHDLAKKDVYRSASMLRTVYEPANPQFYEEMESGELVGRVNIHKPSNWLTETPTDATKMPHRFETFFKSFVPDPEELEYVLEWMYCVITDRVTPVLCLIGVGGTGKDHLAQLLAHGVGHHNYEKVGDSFLEQFNSQIKNKRLIFYDEVSIIKPEMYNRFKQLTNPYIQYESKGKDAVTIKNHASGIYASNKPEEVPFMPGERRFSVPRITSTPLLINFQNKYGEVKGKEEQEKFSETVLSYDLSEDIINFYHWLSNKFSSKDVNRTKQHAFITPYSLELAHKNLADWKREIVEHLEENFHLRCHYLKDIKARIEPDRRKLFPKSNTISKFLSEFVDENGICMGSVNRGNRGKRSHYKNAPYIEITDEFFNKIRKKLGMDVEISENYPEDIPEEELEDIEEFEEFTIADLQDVDLEEIDPLDLL